MKLYEIANSSYHDALSLNFLLADMDLNFTEEDNNSTRHTQICLAYNDANYISCDSYKFISRVLTDFDNYPIEIL